MWTNRHRPTVLSIFLILSVQAAASAFEQSDWTQDECARILESSTGDLQPNTSKSSILAVSGKTLVAHWITSQTNQALNRLVEIKKGGSSAKAIYDPTVYTLVLALVDNPTNSSASGLILSEANRLDLGNQHNRIYIQQADNRARFARIVSIEALPRQFAAFLGTGTVLLRFRKVDDGGQAIIPSQDGVVELELPIRGETARVRFTINTLPLRSLDEL